MPLTDAQKEDQKRLEKLFDKDLAESLVKRGAVPAAPAPIQFLNSGLYQFNKATGGGLPKQRITEVSGQPGTGKTLLALQIVQYVIEHGGRVAWFEAEEALDPGWMSILGIDPDIVYGIGDLPMEQSPMHIYHPDYIESGLETVKGIAATNVYDLIVYDSIGGSPSLALYEASLEDSQMTQLARALHKFKAVMPAALRKGHAALLMINTTYENIGLRFFDSTKPHGGKYIASGGSGIGFLSTVRIMTYGYKFLKEKDKGPAYGKEFKGMVWKNKVATFPREYELHLHTDPTDFINVPWDLMQTASELNVLEQRGHFWYHESRQVATNNGAMERLLQSDIELFDRVEAQVQARIQATRWAKEVTSGIEAQQDPEEAYAGSLPPAGDDPQLQGELSGLFGSGSQPDAGVID